MKTIMKTIVIVALITLSAGSSVYPLARKLSLRKKPPVPQPKPSAPSPKPNPPVQFGMQGQRQNRQSCYTASLDKQHSNKNFQVGALKSGPAKDFNASITKDTKSSTYQVNGWGGNSGKGVAGSVEKRW